GELPSDKPPDRKGPSPGRIQLLLSQLLGRKRAAIGLTVEQVAQLAGISTVEIERYEGGAKVPFEHVVVLARILSIPMGELPGFRGDGDTPVEQAVSGAARALADPLLVIYTFR